MAKKYILSAIALLSAVSAYAKITMGAPFADNMILQRDKDVAVFGKANPDSKVKVSFAGQNVEAVAGKDGKWIATLKPMSASAENRVMTVSESTGEKVEIKNVLVGEVWLCSGQSNMDCPLWGGGKRYRAKNGGLFVQLANYDNIRFFATPCEMSLTPRDRLYVKWSSFKADNPKARTLSACGAFFGVQLYQSLGVPIGLIDANWGGTKIEPWTPACGFKSVSSLKNVYDSIKDLTPDFHAEEKAEMKKQKKFPNRHQQPTVVFNAVLSPIVPYTIRGVIWYQGCSNIGDYRYANMMHALYNGWTSEFKNPDLQFYFAQLAPYTYRKDKVAGQKLINISWEQQTKFANEQPNAKMVLTNDVGDLGDIHPYDKQTVGLRMAAMALQHTYKMSSINADSPSFREAKVEKDKVIMEFDNVKNFYVRSERRADLDLVHFMEIAGEDGKFVKAHVELKGAKLIARANGIMNPKKIRFLYAVDSQCNVFNEHGLPLNAFKADLR